MKVDRFFDEAARARVTAEIQAAEARSRGEIVPVVLEKSDPYPEARPRGAILGLGIATAAALIAGFPLHLAELALVQLGALVAGWWLAAFDPVERFLIGRAALAEAARIRAQRAFQEHGLHRTAEGTGVLIFASLFEHAVVILGDKGIDAKMGTQGWQEAADRLVSAIRAGRPADGFCEAVRLCGDRLAQHFPKTGTDAGNELGDQLRTER
jgi:putative membrane protein